jgi:type III secretion system low calcium response chaperone LcrH/SycD
MTDNAAPQTALEISPEELQVIMEAVLQGARPADAAGVPQKQLEALYALGYNFYTAGRFEDAQTVFQGLCLFDHADSRFWTGLGASLQAGGRFDKAIDVYSMAAMTTGLADPAPIYYAAQCYLKMGRPEEAVAALEGIPALGAEGNAAHAAVKAQAAGLLEALKAEGRPAQ